MLQEERPYIFHTILGRLLDVDIDEMCSNICSKPLEMCLKFMLSLKIAYAKHEYWFRFSKTQFLNVIQNCN